MARHWSGGRLFSEHRAVPQPHDHAGCCLTSIKVWPIIARFSFRMTRYYKSTIIIAGLDYDDFLINHNGEGPRVKPPALIRRMLLLNVLSV